MSVFFSPDAAAAAAAGFSIGSRLFSYLVVMALTLRGWVAVIDEYSREFLGGRLMIGGDSAISFARGGFGGRRGCGFWLLLLETVRFECNH